LVGGPHLCDIKYNFLLLVAANLTPGKDKNLVRCRKNNLKRDKCQKKILILRLGTLKWFCSLLPKFVALTVLKISFILVISS